MNRFLTTTKVLFKSLLIGWVFIPVLALIPFYIIKLIFDLSERRTNLFAGIIAVLSLLSPIFIFRIIIKSSTAREGNDGPKAASPTIQKDIESSHPYGSDLYQFGKAPLHWYGQGQKLKVKKYVLSDPMTYWSKGKSRIVEPCAIDLKASVGRPESEAKGAMGYWPTYSDLSDNQKANYLQWMAGDRKSDLDEIGYPFIFFYGLERRLLVDGIDHQPIISETSRLLRRYRFSKSFNGYLSRFLSYSVASIGLENFDAGAFQSIFESSVDIRFEECLSVSLAWFYHNKIPLPAAWAKLVADRDPRSSKSIVINRVQKEYDKLFTKMYADAFGGGMLLKAAKRDLKIEYFPASSALGGHDIPPVKIPNILAISSQFKRLVEIRKRCIDDLKQLSRVVLKGDDATSRETYEALPEELRADHEHPDHHKWEELRAEHMKEDGALLVEVSTVAKIQNIPFRERLTKKQSESLGVTAEAMGLGIEPDTRITKKNYRWRQMLSLFRLTDLYDPPDPEKYAGASMILELGIAVAAADGLVNNEEINHISRFLGGVINLDANTSKRLEALKAIYLLHPPKLIRIANRLKNILNESHKEKVGEFVIGVASSDGKVSKDEIAILKRLYKALDIPDKKLNDIVSQMRMEASEPVEVKTATPSKAKGEALPPQEEEGAFVLNQSRIHDIIVQTREVAQILGKAMGEINDDEEEMNKDTSTEAEPVKRSFEGLDSRYNEILSKLLEKQSWDATAFDNLIREHKLMPSSTISVINEWAEEYLDDFIIEEDDGITINLSLIKE